MKQTSVESISEGKLGDFINEFMQLMKLNQLAKPEKNERMIVNLMSDQLKVYE